MHKGIILSGGLGSRLYPCTEVLSKQLLPVYDKPLIYYSLSVLMMAGIRDILFITTPKDIKQFKNLLKDGSQWGLNITYKSQENPNGIAECFLLGESWIKNDSITLILGDNIFYGNDLTNRLNKLLNNNSCVIFAYHSKNPKRYGVLNLDKKNKLLEVVEKPEIPPSDYAVTGLYHFDNKVIQYAKTIKPSLRNELEIKDIINLYIKNNNCKVEYLNRGMIWIDAGTFDSLEEASSLVKSIQKRTGCMIACLEEIAYKKGWISKQDIITKIKKYKNSDYGKYLEKFISSSQKN